MEEILKKLCIWGGRVTCRQERERTEGEGERESERVSLCYVEVRNTGKREDGEKDNNNDGLRFFLI
jgi:hypothetical protein